MSSANDPADDDPRDACVLVVCGLEAEARIARGPGAIVIAGGGDRRRLTSELATAAPAAAGIVSFGVAGGLAPLARPGDVYVADAVLAPGGHRAEAHADWGATIASALSATRATIVGVETPLCGTAEKSALHAATGAHLVDMESHIVADIASAHGLPFAVVRVVSDPAHRALPHAAAVGMRADGKVDLPAIFRSLARRPGQLPDLVRTGLDARAAFAALLRCRQRLGPRFALLDLG